jgi:ABC-type multidrug transport system fused ATPase/permease subunit
MIANLFTRDPWGLLVRLWEHMSRRRRRQFVLVSALILSSAFAEVISLSAVLPFIGILAEPEWIFGHTVFGDILRRWGITAVLWASTRLASVCGADVSIEVYRRTLYQPYSVHVTRNSSEVISGITNKVHGVVFGVLLPLLTMISSLVMTAAITVALIAINPKINLLVIGAFGAIYGLITLVSRGRLRDNSNLIAREQTQLVRALQEGLGGIRDVLLDGAQPVYCDVYRQADSALRRAEGNNHFIGQSPRFAMEALGMMFIAVLAYALSGRPGGIAAALPLLGALALGAQRLLPALQQAHSSWANIMGHRAALSDVVDLLDQVVAPELLRAPPAALSFLEAISFRSVRFRYASDAPDVLSEVSLEIPRGARIGFVGATGSGKSTLMDLLMGLLSPSEGRLLIDGMPLQGESVRAWQRTVAHVPQSIFLADATLAENIAFGVAAESIDLERVRQVAQQAQIAEFIESGPLGYQARVGERGVRLSGGQRQRIGIARALYKNPSVLVLDEATSALDNATERSVMDAIDGLSRELTILIIAHRLTTVQRCDTIVELRNGRVVAQGPYRELLESSPTFRHMAHGARQPSGIT